MSQPKMSIAAVRRIVSDVKFFDREFYVTAKGDGYLLQLQYNDLDVETGRMERQHGRKWYVSPYSTKSEIVRSVLKACLTSMEHITREHFTFRGQRIFGPHLDVDNLVELAKTRKLKLERRDPLPKKSALRKSA